MKCPACHHRETKVVDSRLVSEGLAIRRRRECLRCAFRFSTQEEVEVLHLTVVKRDGTREPYMRQKMEAGIRRAFQKRPLTNDALKKLLGKIERDLQKQRKEEIPSKKIGDIVLKYLKRIDQVAYIRFASVYEDFRDAKTFQHALDKLLSHRNTRKRTVNKRK
ncbi:MAG: transcriptional regulator NrdR [Parcubacteria group bacterium CG08_land_8_20_14_0_20_48_21]|nr:MAG: transcriptional regulator NrdR [Parcubacteria group bacterium CG2_30_48_51]PIS33246.1 MAG: transcriptional regulator NrdR [Parcubacteria group bacterium CG08_land_8_20_14_0_20_48_21]PIW79057.1 MAG: transcriptional regulator NrdR [Parcubacteria group bacterium CG_4_8_14_3_um_filter_48_16]PIY78127.1 MAG: transcriptional regulator NrdR [Parcubacteria group bacterium CG_4_10_14_0_8_um_filter_48_154]PIZ77054.1 MAG: transcriptional regulator NrdR [bacterium CG_4_10_14_0_2_um_filter_48_144]PJ